MREGVGQQTIADSGSWSPAPCTILWFHFLPWLSRDDMSSPGPQWYPLPAPGNSPWGAVLLAESPGWYLLSPSRGLNTSFYKWSLPRVSGIPFVPWWPCCSVRKPCLCSWRVWRRVSAVRPTSFVNATKSDPCLSLLQAYERTLC